MSKSLRLEYFRSRVAEGGIYRRHALRLKEAELNQCVEFIELNDKLDHLQFEFAVNRMFLDLQKPRNWNLMIELLHMANGIHFKRRSWG